MRLQATQEGLVPLKTWVKSALDRVIQDCMGERDLEFVWVGDDAIDPLQQAQTLNILVSAGIKTREEARAELGLGGDKAAAGLGEYNPNHDERGQFATADNAVATATNRRPQETVARKPNSAENGNWAQFALAGVLIDQRYDDTTGVTRCTYRTPLGTYTIEYQGEPRACPTTTPAPL